ncbi:MAG: restriction endonuclease subunit S [Candidatus Kapaibacterium sp.]|nr:MAG: restriction endonuclease subunit S [Candidatus Kapabacteria bacterium]
MMGEKNSLEKFGILDIPKGWQIKKLKDILIEGRLGGNYENAEANNGVPVIKMGNLDRATIKIDKIQYLPENETYNQEDVLVKGDLLFNTRNTLELVGKVAIWNNELPFAVYNSNLMRMKFDSSFVESTWFMNRAFNSYYGLRQLRGIATGTTSVAAIYGRDLESIKFLLPPLSEQKAIAQVLSTADAAIHTTEKLITQKELRKKWLMQQLLTGKKRLKGFSGEWKEYYLGDMFSERNETRCFDLPLLSIGQNGVYPQDESVKKDTSNEDKSKYKRICPGDIGYNTMRMWQGRSALSELEGIVSPAYTVVTPKKNADSVFFSYLFKIPKMTNLFWRKSQGLVDDTLNCKFKDFSIVKVILPQTKEEQTAIAQVLQAADKEIQLLKAKAEKLREQKKGLMQVLLTGKVRLKINNNK